jgi:hypothetical protein
VCAIEKGLLSATPPKGYVKYNKITTLALRATRTGSMEPTDRSGSVDRLGCRITYSAPRGLIGFIYIYI